MPKRPYTENKTAEPRVKTSATVTDKEDSGIAWTQSHLGWAETTAANGTAVRPGSEDTAHCSTAQSAQVIRGPRRWTN